MSRTFFLSHPCPFWFFSGQGSAFLALNWDYIWNHEIALPKRWWTESKLSWQDIRGLRLKLYRCPPAKLTIGIGCNLDDRATHDHLPKEVPLLVSFHFGFFFLMLHSKCEFLNIKTLNYPSKLYPRQLKRFFRPGAYQVFNQWQQPQKVRFGYLALGIAVICSAFHTLIMLRSQDWVKLSFNDTLDAIFQHFH